MKFHLLSDLHLEMLDFDLSKVEGVEKDSWLILAGDICIEKYCRGSREKRFFSTASDMFKKVVYIPGNHEHYYGDYLKTADRLMVEINYPNVVVADRDAVRVNKDTVILACEMPASMNNSNPVSVSVIGRAISDFSKIILCGDNYLTPNDVFLRHVRDLSWIKKSVDRYEGDNIIIVTHTAPSSLSVHEVYKHDYDVNGFYYSELTDFIMDHPNIKAWCHGHMHDFFDYNIETDAGKCRVMCNPRGYINSARSGFNKDFFFEI